MLLLPACAVAQEVKPEATEDWLRKPPLVTPAGPNRAPSDAIVLFAGAKDLDKWEHPDGSAVKWEVKGNVLTIVPKTKDIRTKQSFGSMQLHIEWKTPDPEENHGRNNMGNSGVLFMGLYELQIYESYDYRERIYYNGQAGSIYKQYAPLANASLPPQTWQTFDVVFEAPVFNADSTLKTPARITVFQNGILIQNHVAIKGPMVYAGYPKYVYHPARLPLVLQEHGSKVSFRNIWVREL
ncbi:MAG TPA: DUF1080 domain-containing protein [Chitinophaga sp.]|uniref:3-keto-disaccharide hydrolase n=1 Tax=Chitinophaga sp. TaxID=1869181 RepID=UPI002DC015E5|nr:DUF1080 domain-containing protein [Chitinophaga sp.]HEU4555465.1 DUF1080 domain-containing protein [Chitinophaga sp.]